MSESQPKLFLIGLGIVVPGHVTFQASHAMSQCAEIYSIVQEPAQLWLPPGAFGKIKVVNVLEWYVENKIRTQNYENVARSILKAVVPNRNIGYVTYGNPMAYDRVAQNLVEYSREGKFTVQVIPGISSIDTVLCDLGFDIAPAIQVFEASWLVACKIHPRVDMPVLLMQVGAFGSLRTHYSKRHDGSSLTDLIKHLSPFYPSSHLTYLVRSTTREDQRAGVCEVTLSNLCRVTAEQLSGASLYIPPVTNTEPDAAILALMTEA